jgi:hypothetical protein
LTPVTTEKDRVRLEWLDGARTAAIVALPVRLVLADEAAARTLLRAALERRP